MKVKRTAALLAATALAAPLAAQREAPMLRRCEVEHFLPDGPPRTIDYQMVEAPAGSTTEVGVLFLYTDRFAASVSRLDDGSGETYRAILKEAQELDAILRIKREAAGGEVVVVMAESKPGNYCGGGIAEVFLTSTAGMRSKAYAVVGIPTDQTVTCDYDSGVTLAHEVGHLLGLMHDAATIDIDQGAGSVARWRDSGLLHDSKGFGYLNPTPLGPDKDGAQQYAGTVMAYSRGAYNLHGFSRPAGDLTVAGYGLGQTLDGGDSTTWADRALRRTAATVAAFYNEPPTEPDDEDEDEDDGPGATTCTWRGDRVDCQLTPAGQYFTALYFHEGEWKAAEIAISSGDSAVF